MEAQNIIGIIAEHFLKKNELGKFLLIWENCLFSLIVSLIIIISAYFAWKKHKTIPSRFQAAIEFLMETIDDFVNGILGKRGRHFLPFLGTIFIFILISNLLGFIPLMKSPTTSLSMTVALALCVFFYVQYTAFNEMGFKGYIDHLMGSPRGAIAFSVLMPLFMFGLHVLSELIRPVSLSLRLRSNILGDDMLMATLAHMGIAWLPLLFFSMLLSMIAAIVQALVFSLLSTVYFALALPDEKH